MTLSELRARHSRLVYQSFETKIAGSMLTVTFSILLEPDIVFHPTVTIPLGGEYNEPIVNIFAFHLGLMECISYWKAACPSQLIVKADSLDTDQIAWWHDLFLNGLGEFFFTNKIDFTQKDFLKITSIGEKFESARLPAQNLIGDLVLVGGGKDSAVALEILKKTGRPTRPMVLNPTRASLENIRIVGFADPIIIRRTVDPKLLDLNKNGYLNGHTPFSAYLAFLGLFVATIHGYKHAIVSNEASASEGNVLYKGFDINHQYSKSFGFETLFRQYAAKYLPTKSEYFSLLRPINELQIARIFSTYPKYFSSFRSCNVGSKTNSWCGNCPKCAFSWLILSPFIPKGQLVHIFGSDLSKKPKIKDYIQELIGLGKQKPFECVGTRDECTVAFNFNDPAMAKLKKTVLESWNNEHFVPERYTKTLRSML